MAATTLSAVRAEIKGNPGKVYVYVLSRPCGTPFYVGVGTGRRVAQHERYVAVGLIKAPVHAIVAEIKATGVEVGYEIAAWFEDWADAAAEERRLIAFHGRADLSLGPLANRTNGGQGTAGIDWHASPKRAEAVRKAAEKNRGRKHTEEHRAKISASGKGRVVTAETRAKLSAANKGQVVTDEQRAKMSAARKGKPLAAAAHAGRDKYNEDHAPEIAAHRRELWADPDYRERMSKSLRGVKRSPEFAESNRRRQVEKFSDPEFRERWNAARVAGLSTAEAKERMREAAKANWSDPEFRQRMKIAREKSRQARREKEN